MPNNDSQNTASQDIQYRCYRLTEDIEDACIRNGLNITIYDGGIGLIDQEGRKLVAVWRPEYIMPSSMLDMK